MVKRESSADIDEAAARWVARIDRGALPEAEQLSLEQWLEADVRRQGAFAKANAIMAHSDRARALGPGSILNEGVPSAFNRRRAILMGGGAIAASLAGAIIAGDFWRRHSLELTTAKGEVRHVPLADGSSVTLNTASVVRVNYSPAVRDVELLAGEALFDVARDKQRPFVVHAGDTRVRAVGTSFTVRREKDGVVRVLVSEGVVEVTKAGQSEPVRVGANVVAVTAPTAPETTTSTVAINAPVRVQTVGPNEVARGLSWREGMLAFDGESLSAAAAEFDRYSSTRIVIDDPDLGRETVTGLFSASDPTGFAKAVAVSFSGKVTVQGDEVHLTR